MTEMISTTEELEGSSTCRIRLSGAINVSNAQVLHQTVVNVCEKFPQVELLLHDVTAFDAACMQILRAAQREATTKVTIQTGENADCVAHWLGIAGLSCILQAHVA